jgi:hypothetical protein
LDFEDVVRGEAATQFHDLAVAQSSQLLSSSYTAGKEDSKRTRGKLSPFSSTTTIARFPPHLTLSFVDEEMNEIQNTKDGTERRAKRAPIRKHVIFFFFPFLFFFVVFFT